MAKKFTLEGIFSYCSEEVEDENNNNQRRSRIVFQDWFNERFYRIICGKRRV